MEKIGLVSDTISKGDILKLIEWLSSDPTPQLTKGPLTIEFQNKWSNLFSTTKPYYSCFVNSGSSAILLGLLALKEWVGIQKVVVPSLSWATDLSSPMILGMEPIICDCNMHDLSYDLTKLEYIFQEQKPDACILVSVLGLVPDMDRIMKLCEKYKVFLIEDVCESMGSSYKGRLLGTFGIISLFSFYFGHHLSTIEGGMLCTPNKELGDLFLSMRNHGWDRDWDEDKKKEIKDKYWTSDFQSMYTFYHPGLNVRSTDLQAFLGIHQIDKLKDYTEKRNRNFEIYLENIEYNAIRINNNPENFISNFAFPVVHYRRDIIIKKLQEDNIEVRPLIAGSMAKQPFASKIKKPLLPNSDLIHNYGFYLPNHQDLKEKDIKRICDIVNSEKIEHC